MERGTSRNRSARWWIAAAVVVALVAATVVLIPYSPLKTTTKARLTQLLVARLGPGAEVGNIDYGWRSVTLSGLRLPLDKHGSLLRVERVEVTIDPFSVVRAPDRIERMVHALRFVEPEFVIRSGAARAADSTIEVAWLPSVKVPAAAFSALSRLDSLKHVEIQHGTVALESVSGVRRPLATLDATLQTDPAGVLQISGRGIYGDRSAQTLTLTGRFVAAGRQAELQALLDIPAGPPPSLLGTLPLALTTRGGNVALRARLEDSVLTLGGSASLRDVEAETPAGPVHVASLQATLSTDTLLFEPFVLTAPAGTVAVSGGLILRGRGTAGCWRETLTSPMRGSCTPSGPPFRGSKGRLLGTSRCAARWPRRRAPSSSAVEPLRIAGLPLENLDLDATFQRTGLTLREAVVVTREGTLEFAGGSTSLPAPRLNITGRMRFANAPRLSVWTSELREIRLEALGLIAEPQVRVALTDAVGQDLCRGTLQRQGTVWALDLQTAENGVSRVTVEPDDGTLRLELLDAHHVLATLFAAWRPVLSPVQSVDIRFTGDAASGAIEWDGAMDPAAGAVWARVAREFHFRGHYARTGSEDLALEGSWNGLAGNGDPFEGKAQLTLEDSVLTVDHFFIDVYGDIKGSVDLRSRRLDMELSIADLVLDKLPLPPALAEKYGLRGAVSGYLRVAGTLDRPQWTASLAMIDGSILNVPGYWMNLDAGGVGLAAQIRSFEIGRDVRKILAASGSLDVERQQIAITATLGAARAEDFLLALDGQERSDHRRTRRARHDHRRSARARHRNRRDRAQRKAGEGIRGGRIRRPFPHGAQCRRRARAADSTLRVFPRRANTSFPVPPKWFPATAASCRRTWKAAAIFWTCWTRRTAPSARKAAMAVWRWTLAAPSRIRSFSAASSTLRHGKFSYLDATPGLVSAEIAFRVAASGEVESGVIELRMGDQWLRLQGELRQHAPRPRTADHSHAAALPRGAGDRNRRHRRDGSPAGLHETRMDGRAHGGHRRGPAAHAFRVTVPTAF